MRYDRIRRIALRFESALRELDQLEADLARFGITLAEYLGWPEPPPSPAPAGKAPPPWLRAVISGGRADPA